MLLASYFSHIYKQLTLFKYYLFQIRWVSLSIYILAIATVFEILLN